MWVSGNDCQCLIISDHCGSVVYRVLTASIANNTSTSWQSSYKTHCDVAVNVLYCEVENIVLSHHDSKRVLSSNVRRKVIYRTKSILVIIKVNYVDNFSQISTAI